MQPVINFPKRQFGNRERSFSSKWYNGREYIEYSKEKDAAFCYPCRKYGAERGRGRQSDNSDKIFTVFGYRDWKHALDTKKGFPKHDASQVHLENVLRWKEHHNRMQKNKEVSTLVNSEQLERNRYYLKCIKDVIQWLIISELPLRGDKENGAATSHSVAEEDVNEFSPQEGDGLFLRLFQYTMMKDEKLMHIYATIPKNAKYTSPEIQNECIQILADLVRHEVVQLVKSADIPLFTLKMDGTQDPTHVENLSIVLRFVRHGEVIEKLLDIDYVTDLSAKGVVEKSVDALTSFGLSVKNIVSQCYDGASVMSGRLGGVQKLLSEAAGKHIPYVHCMNHQLHLVVVHAISTEDCVKQYFEICSQLYNFLRHPTVYEKYSEWYKAASAFGTKMEWALENVSRNSA